MFANPDNSEPFCQKNKNQIILVLNTLLAPKKFTLSFIDLLGVTMDDKFNFNLHINRICKPTLNQLNALIQLKYFLRSKKRKALLNSFILSNFNEWPLVWMLKIAKSLREIEATQERPLYFMIKNYGSTYKDLLNKAGNPNI